MAFGLMSDKNTKPAVPPSGRLLMDFFDRLSTSKEIFFYHVRTVGDVMRTGFETVNPDTILKDIWMKMTEDGLKDLPVVEIDNSVRGAENLIYVGSVRKMDLAALFSRFIGALSQPASDDRAEKIRLSNVNAIDRDVQGVPPETDLLEAIAMMLEKDVETLAVVDANKTLQGVVSIRDILGCFEYLNLLQGARTAETKQELRIVDLFSDQGGSMPTDKMLGTFVGTAREVMRESVPSLLPSSSIGDAARLLDQTQRQTAVVVDADGKIKGIVTATEIQLALPPILKRTERASVRKNPEMFQMNPEASDVRTTLAEKVGMVTMTNPPIISSETDIMTIARKLSAPDAIEMPVISPDGHRIVGVVGREDLLKAFAALGGLAKKRGMLDE